MSLSVMATMIGAPVEPGGPSLAGPGLLGLSTMFSATGQKAVLIAALGLAVLSLVVFGLKYIAAAKDLKKSRARIRELEEYASALRLQAIAGSPSVRDTATGLFTREYLEASFDREIRRAQRQKTPVAIILIALPRIVEIRSKLGNEGADFVLREVAGLLQRSIRGSDVACRFDQDEFALLLPGMSFEQAATRAYEFKAIIENLQIAPNGQTVGRLVTQVGAAAHPDHSAGANFQAVLRAASASVYEARTWQEPRRVGAV